MNELKETAIQMLKDFYEKTEYEDGIYYYIGGHSIKDEKLDKILSKLPLADFFVESILEEFFRGDIPF
jgi:hypothetical protein